MNDINNEKQFHNVIMMLQAQTWSRRVLSSRSWRVRNKTRTDGHVTVALTRVAFVDDPVDDDDNNDDDIDANNLSALIINETKLASQVITRSSTFTRTSDNPSSPFDAETEMHAWDPLDLLFLEHAP
jgi:hypothetical protein